MIPSFLLLCLAGDPTLATSRPGGVNAAPAQAPLLAELPGVSWSELACAGFTVRVPAGTWTGSATAPLPGPVAALRLGDGPWIGGGYVETDARPIAFTGTASGPGAALSWRFDDGATWTVHLAAEGARLRIDEDSTLGPRDRWVLDLAPGWDPASAMLATAGAATCCYLTLPCHFDRREGLLLPATASTAFAALAVAAAGRPMALAMAVDPGDGPGIELWQRRQRGRDTATRHILGPDTKSDGIEDPRTAHLLGPSVWSAHVTVEFRLRSGRRTTWLRLGAWDGRADGLPAVVRQVLP